MAKEGEPRWAFAAGFRSVVFDEDTLNDILVDLDTKRLGYDHCNPKATEASITAFELNNGANELLVGTLNAGLCISLWGEEHSAMDEGVDLQDVIGTFNQSGWKELADFDSLAGRNAHQSYLQSELAVVK